MPVVIITPLNTITNVICSFKINQAVNIVINGSKYRKDPARAESISFNASAQNTKETPEHINPRKRTANHPLPDKFIIEYNVS